ncbi:MAG: Xaa-Pro peptidase family protein, partial [Acidimicrobiia bacterium]|nr:Xaa-Pro peptidase family protein [Acidimicrobiia bacterium]
MIGELLPVHVPPRWLALRAAMDDAGIDALVVDAPSNVRYLTGFTGSAGIVALTATDAALLTDGRYAGQAPQQLASVAAPCSVDADAPARADAMEAMFEGCEHIGLEADTATWAQHQARADRLGGHRLVATHALVEDLRAVKDEAEIERMAAAADIATGALASVIDAGLGGRTERDVGLALDDAIRRTGASGPAYETIVASGPNAALPHARPTDRRIDAGDLVIIDVGAVVEGYRSDMTRTFSVGDPSDEASELLDVVTEAQAAAVDVVMAGAEIAEVDRVARRVISDVGLGDLFVHGTGHGVGLDIHEAPAVSGRSTATLQRGQCITVEPGVYRSGFGGVRVE